MIPGGSLGTHIREHSMLGVGSGAGMGWSWDGTYWVLKNAGTTIARIHGTTGTLEIAGVVKTGVSF
jgi:hypothetical protein